VRWPSITASGKNCNVSSNASSAFNKVLSNVVGAISNFFFQQGYNKYVKADPKHSDDPSREDFCHLFYY
jgi:hypothetical protein